MLFETQILDFSPPENGRVKFEAQIEDIMRGIVTIAHLDFPIEQNYKVRKIDGVDHAVKVWQIGKGDIPFATLCTLDERVCFSLADKICDVLNQA